MKEQIRKLIADGKTEDAIEVLLSHNWKNHKYITDSIIILKSQLKEIKHSEIIGAISFSEARIQKAKINDGILRLLDTTPIVVQNNDNDKERKFNIKGVLFFATIGFLTFLIALFGIYYFSNDSVNSKPSQDSQLLVQCKENLIWDAKVEADVLSSYNPNPIKDSSNSCKSYLILNKDNVEANGLYARSLLMEGKISNALFQFEEAASLGDDYSCLVLGLYYLLGENTSKEKGLTYLQKSGKLGNSAALLEIGKCYEFGKIQTPDYGSAAIYYSKASELNSMEATFRLAQLLEFGLGIDENISLAKSYYEKAAKNGLQDAITALKEIKKNKSR